MLILNLLLILKQVSFEKEGESATQPNIWVNSTGKKITHSVDLFVDFAKFSCLYICV